MSGHIATLLRALSARFVMRALDAPDFLDDSSHDALGSSQCREFGELSPRPSRSISESIESIMNLEHEYISRYTRRYDDQKA